MVIRYGLYNVGDSVASDIVLTEAGFGTDDFDVAGILFILKNIISFEVLKRNVNVHIHISYI